MSKKMLADYCKKIPAIYKNYPAYTSAIKIYEESNCTYALMLTDDLTIFSLKYNPDCKEVYMSADTFELKNEDILIFCHGETNDMESFCDTVAQFMYEHHENWRPTLDEKGFKRLLKTRKAILNRRGTYFPLGFTIYTREQQKNSNMIEFADVAMVCINCTKDNPIPGAISTMLDVMFDSASCTYRKAFERNRRDANFASFNYAFSEYVTMDMSTDAVRELYELISNVIGNRGYPFAEDF